MRQDMEGIRECGELLTHRWGAGRLGPADARCLYP
jgi:hypothetical protein